MRNGPVGDRDVARVCIDDRAEVGGDEIRADVGLLLSAFS